MLSIKDNETRICAILTSFNADANFKDRIERISKQVNQIVIVDNHSDEISLNRLRNIADKKIYIIYNPINKGVAKALNQGINWARGKNFDFVLLLDQDTILGETMVETLIHHYFHNKNIYNIGIIGSNYSDIENNLQMLDKKSDDSSNIIIVKSVITSGSLVPITIFNKVGPFLNELFIDFVDIEFCLRVRSYGYKVLLTKELLMRHSIGSAYEYRMLWKKTSSSNHSPLRRYYMMRNNIIVARKYFLKYPLWSINSIINRIKSILLMLIFEKERVVKFKYTLLGLFDGLTGRSKMDNRIYQDE